MKIQRISIASLLFALLLMVGNSCSDDNPYFSNELGSKLEMTKETNYRTDYRPVPFAYRFLYKGVQCNR